MISAQETKKRNKEIKQLTLPVSCEKSSCLLRCKKKKENKTKKTVKKNKQRHKKQSKKRKEKKMK